MKRIACIVVALMSLAACGGGGGGGGGGSSRDTALAPKGIYAGSFVEEGLTFDIAGIVPDGDQGYFFSSESSGIFVATLETDGSSLDGAFDSYIGVDGSEFSLVAERFASGSVLGMVTANAFSASFNTSQGTSGTISLTKSSANSIQGGLLSVAGTWGVTDSSGTATLVIDNNGAVVGSDDEGCQYTGQIVASSSGVNANRLQLSVACPDVDTVSLNGAIARGNPSDETNTLILIVANDDLALAAVLFEQ